jgi:phage regulator Rha-like protein
MMPSTSTGVLNRDYRKLKKELMSSEVKTMSSVDIARLTGKRHAHVLRDVESLINQTPCTILIMKQPSIY